MAECQWAPPWEYLPVTDLRVRVDAASWLAAPKASAPSPTRTAQKFLPSRKTSWGDDAGEGCASHANVARRDAGWRFTGGRVDRGAPTQGWALRRDRNHPAYGQLPGFRHSVLPACRKARPWRQIGTLAPARYSCRSARRGYRAARPRSGIVPRRLRLHRGRQVARHSRADQRPHLGRPFPRHRASPDAAMTSQPFGTM